MDMVTVGTPAVDQWNPKDSGILQVFYLNGQQECKPQCGLDF